MQIMLFVSPALLARVLPLCQFDESDVMLDSWVEFPLPPATFRVEGSYGQCRCRMCRFPAMRMKRDCEVNKRSMNSVHLFANSRPVGVSYASTETHARF